MKSILLALALTFGASAAFAQMGDMPMGQAAAKTTVPSHTLTITAGGKSVALTMADLKAMPQRTLHVHNGHNNQDETYTGVGVDTLLGQYGLTMANGGATKVYHSYIKAEGTDKYWVLYSGSELFPDFHTGDAIIALTINGEPIKANGEFKMVIGADRKPARWVNNLSALTITTLE